ncbi:MAG: hypothetical protein SAK29_00510 [Scytonema sp. PMC 1069.18]|nr:hypothetical protein [Scytonema sp. PMC 1069.18]MEC4882599.1 hypothetical protein [Scytonema sp. PMC 1070.18]
MFKRLIQWLKNFFQRLSRRQTPAQTEAYSQKEPPPPLTDTDLEFLFTQLLEGVHQAKGQAWAQKWLDNIEHRVSTERWLEWLQRFGDRLLSSASPNNELASRMVQLGELDVGEVGDIAYDIGMQLLTRNSGEPIWEYDGPDAEPTNFSESTHTAGDQGEVLAVDELPEGEFQTITLDQLLVLLEQDENLRNQVAQQLGTQTDDPQMIIQALIEQYNATE